MKKRTFYKYFSCTKCAHDKTYDSMVTDDPYPMYITIFQCACKPYLSGKLIGDVLKLNNDYFPCDECKSFTLSRKSMHDALKKKEFNKRLYRKIKYKNDLDSEKIIDDFFDAFS